MGVNNIESFQQVKPVSDPLEMGLLIISLLLQRIFASGPEQVWVVLGEEQAKRK
jgi:hypothetical protein